MLSSQALLWTSAKFHPYRPSLYHIKNDDINRRTAPTRSHVIVTSILTYYGQDDLAYNGIPYLGQCIRSHAPDVILHNLVSSMWIVEIAIGTVLYIHRDMCALLTTLVPIYIQMSMCCNH